MFIFASRVPSSSNFEHSGGPCDETLQYKRDMSLAPQEDVIGQRISQEGVVLRSERKAGWGECQALSPNTQVAVSREVGSCYQQSSGETHNCNTEACR